jgi:hypothetical protein
MPELLANVSCDFLERFKSFRRRRKTGSVEWRFSIRLTLGLLKKTQRSVD